ncbi:hypothetical protein EGR_02888 [Echinococcus granulosus]|uniref:Uncharacterized protein n=1 Tax=Echinococcus granulosus TaxID=6210 RepID=W6ULX6_ECHGR|nr:hypothetical protein EGR_02888 [Echinococcus granulosus]EUB62136.1 hypothetical protein EGR_02888 [Echinococcus granulosus]
MLIRVRHIGDTKVPRRRPLHASDDTARPVTTAVVVEAVTANHQSIQHANAQRCLRIPLSSVHVLSLAPLPRAIGWPLGRTSSVIIPIKLPRGGGRGERDKGLRSNRHHGPLLTWLTPHRHSCRSAAAITSQSHTSLRIPFPLCSGMPQWDFLAEDLFDRLEPHPPTQTTRQPANVTLVASSENFKKAICVDLASQYEAASWTDRYLRPESALTQPDAAAFNCAPTRPPEGKSTYALFPFHPPNQA